MDDLLRHKDDHPSIGIILCKAKSKMIVEYALRDTRKPSQKTLRANCQVSRI
ncbi:MAG: DUF1016 family protein [Nitrospirae bacterium]|nr:DUF1016 family protein [Nitrospirota bacterium]